VSESGIAAGVRRIEAVTGTQAYRRAVEHDRLLETAASLVKTTPDALVRKIEQIAEEAKDLRKQLERARQAGAKDQVSELIESATSVDGMRVIATSMEGGDPGELRILGDKLRERIGSGAAILVSRRDDRVSLLVVVTDDLPGRGVRADKLVREITAITGGSGGGRADMAQGGVADGSKVVVARARGADIVRALAGACRGKGRGGAGARARTRQRRGGWRGTIRTRRGSCGRWSVRRCGSRAGAVGVRRRTMLRGSLRGR
jgi:alanyl-tRNA synthetase